MGPGLARQALTVEEFLARGGDERVEFIRGSVVEKAPPTAEHSSAQEGVNRLVGGRFSRRVGARWPGGWWLFPGVDIRFGREVLRPDVCGYRRERHPQRPGGFPLAAPPDWVCEVLSPSTARTDRVEKLQTYFAAGVGHCWLIDPIEGSLEVFRHTELACALVKSAHRGQRLAPEPFDAVEFSVDELLGDDPDDDAP